MCMRMRAFFTRYVHEANCSRPLRDIPHTPEQASETRISPVAPVTVEKSPRLIITDLPIPLHIVPLYSPHAPLGIIALKVRHETREIRIILIVESAIRAPLLTDTELGYPQRTRVRLTLRKEIPRGGAQLGLEHVAVGRHPADGVGVDVELPDNFACPGGGVEGLGAEKREIGRPCDASDHDLALGTNQSGGPREMAERARE